MNTARKCVLLLFVAVAAVSTWSCRDDDDGPAENYVQFKNDPNETWVIQTTETYVSDTLTTDAGDAYFNTITTFYLSHTPGIPDFNNYIRFQITSFKPELPEGKYTFTDLSTTYQGIQPELFYKGEMLVYTSQIQNVATGPFYSVLSGSINIQKSQTGHTIDFEGEISNNNFSTTPAMLHFSGKLILAQLKD